jgi:pimeloyl-ACP methyl ester carboxylesterase
MLEVIDKGSSSESHSTPLLFVHGAWHGAWCWDEYFLDFFAERGYRALAVSLRGHGNSQTSKSLRACSIADYVEDVKSVADDLPARPVVIGHSMGGLVVQKYLESNAAPAGVLLAAIPVRGGGPAVLRYMRRHPWRALKGALTGYTMHNLDTPARARESMFSPGTPETDVVRYLARFQPESQRALFIDQTFRALPRPQNVSTPLLVLGAELDGTFTTAEVRATATAYGTTAEIFPEMGHDMMLEPQWDAVAERIHAWLGTRSL